MHILMFLTKLEQSDRKITVYRLQGPGPNTHTANMSSKQFFSVIQVVSKRKKTE